MWKYHTCFFLSYSVLGTCLQPLLVTPELAQCGHCASAQVQSPGMCQRLAWDRGAAGPGGTQWGWTVQGGTGRSTGTLAASHCHAGLELGIIVVLVQGSGAGIGTTHSCCQQALAVGTCWAVEPKRRSYDSYTRWLQGLQWADPALMGWGLCQCQK